ncbi:MULTISPECIES: hypothetical protein [Acinetobacter]|nr:MULTISPECIES: hypothetical protein [Acinetobacter]MBK0407981.1 hypothetical protein [Acinetobacter pittii]MCW1881435.1 hypothetical protein [Acinetobacter baumannii]MCW1895482.1 hypothetical protein [Acinetobacter baumannii]MCW3178830.1 hypothetical protein [Acinetobacter baumannii]MDH1006780.1 hypothetical protein [Acinetobacter junii]
MVLGVYIKLVMYVAALFGVNTASMGVLFIILGGHYSISNSWIMKLLKP